MPRILVIPDKPIKNEPPVVDEWVTVAVLDDEDAALNVLERVADGVREAETTPHTQQDRTR